MNTPTSTPAQRHILVVEDDAKIADMLTNYLHMHGFETTVCGNGLDAVPLVRAIGPALVVLDLMLPGQDGIAVCEQLRAFSVVPIIMVTARVDEIDRLLGRAEGNLSTPTAAVHVAPGTAPSLVADDATQTIRWGGQPLPLTPVEFRLLRLLLSRPSHVFSRARLLDQLHQDLRDVSDRAIDSHIKNLRRKLEAAGAVGHSVASVYGVGYRFEVELA